MWIAIFAKLDFMLPKENVYQFRSKIVLVINQTPTTVNNATTSTTSKAMNVLNRIFKIVTCTDLALIYAKPARKASTLTTKEPAVQFSRFKIVLHSSITLMNAHIV